MGGGGYGTDDLVRGHRQRRLFRDLPAKWRRGGGSGNWEQEAWLLSYLGHPYGTIAVQTHVCEAPVRGNTQILLNRVLTHEVWRQFTLARFLPPTWLGSGRGLGS